MEEVKEEQIMPFSLEELIGYYERLKDSGIKPKKGKFIDKDHNDKVCGMCAISAHLYCKNILSIDEINYLTKTGPGKAMQILSGFKTRRDMSDFIHGFDASIFENQHHSRGFYYNKGIEYRKAVYERFLSS